MQYKREISHKISVLAQEFPVLVITGARQVGKTTLLQELFPNHQYVSLDIPSTAAMAEENPDLFFAKYSPPILVDEVQYAPKLFRNIKIWVDANRDKKGQIILSGSQKFNLMKEVSDSLAGRVGLIEMEPLSVWEISQNQKLSNLDLPTIIVRGLFPELWKEPGRAVSPYYQAYLNTYLERDVRQIVNVVSLLDFEKFLRLLATRVGQTVEKSTLAKDVGVKVGTINNWLSVLQASNQIHFVQPFHENLGSRIIKSPKLFFSDVGFCTYLLGLDSFSLLHSPILGSLWENLVFIELRKRDSVRLNQGQFWFYRDSYAREVDLLYAAKGYLHFIETKWSTSPDKKVAAFLAELSSRLKSRVLKRGQLFVIARVEDTYSLSSECKTLSLFDFELPGKDS